jgi:glucose-6-phosphate isomerase
MLTAPSVHHLSTAGGTLTGRSHRYEKRLSELAGLYGDTSAFDRALSAGDRVVYAVEDYRPSATLGDLCFGVTHMQPGRIGDEFFLTRGHIHAIGNRPETYRGEAGQGVMLLESPDGQVVTLDVTPGGTVYVPPFWIHRSVNVGPDPLVMTFVYPADSGQDYGIIARSNGMRVRVVADGTGWTTVPNPAWRPRSDAEIAAIHATAA